MVALLDASSLPARLVWNAAVLASELFIAYRGFNEHGNRVEASPNAHRTEATARALARLNSEDKAPTPLRVPPAAWIKIVSRAARRRREGDWAFPDPYFEPFYAKDLIRYFPIETWAALPEYREALLLYADELLRWTVERLFPSWEDRREREHGAAQFYEWLSALATFVGRIAILVPDGYTRFINPIARHEDRQSLSFLSDVTEAVTTRHVYDAAILSEETLSLLAACMDRMLAERTFDPNSYRAGEINTRDLYPMITSFLLVSVNNAPGAARFANGEWTELPLLLPLIDKLIMAAGWSAGIMEVYLILCERAGANFPVEAFTRHVSASMHASGFHSETWNSSDTSAAVSSAIQRLAEAHHPLSREQARNLLILLDQLVDMGDRRAAALQQSEHFRSIQITA